MWHFKHFISPINIISRFFSIIYFHIKSKQKVEQLKNLSDGKNISTMLVYNPLDKKTAALF